MSEDEPFVISHSGGTWESMGKGPNGMHVWPIEEYLARAKHTKNVADRIRRLNPNGKEEGSYIRGWHPDFRFRQHGDRF